MGKKEQHNHKNKERVDAVVQLLTKQSPLTVKQEKFCNSACVERFLKVKGENVKRAAKQLRNCLAWRDSFGIDYLIADEFSAELADGVAYVSGLDHESRPVVIFRMKQNYQKIHSQKLFTRLLVFTLEVAIQTMPKSVDQFVILFDASFFSSASAFMNMLLPSLKIIADYYPARLHRAFVIDPPSLFSYLWKGVKSFVELSGLTMVVSSIDYEDSLELNNNNELRAASFRFNDAKSVGSCSSSRFSFTVSHHFDSVKPWYLSFTDTSSSAKVGPTGPAMISPLNARSYSFASPVARTPRNKGYFPSTPLPQKTQEPLDIRHPRAAIRPSFFQSPAMFFKKDIANTTKADKCRLSFQPYFNFYRRPYDEMTYRSKMRPPLGGLISIVSPHIARRHLSVSQRF